MRLWGRGKGGGEEGGISLAIKFGSVHRGRPGIY